MSEAFEIRSGDFATARRGSVDGHERSFIAAKLASGSSVSAIARMLGRPEADVAALAKHLPHNPRPAFVPLKTRPRPPVVFASGRSPPTREIERIAKEVGQARGVSLACLRGVSRGWAISHPRQEAMWIAYQTGQYTTTQIAAYFGGRDHTTVLHALRRVEARLDEALKYLGFVPIIHSQAVVNEEPTHRRLTA